MIFNDHARPTDSRPSDAGRNCKQDPKQDPEGKLAYEKPTISRVFFAAETLCDSGKTPGFDVGGDLNSDWD